MDNQNIHPLTLNWTKYTQLIIQWRDWGMEGNLEEKWRRNFVVERKKKGCGGKIDKTRERGNKWDIWRERWGWWWWGKGRREKKMRRGEQRNQIGIR